MAILKGNNLASVIVRRSSSAAVVLLAGAAFAGLSAQGAGAAETRSFAVSWFYPAIYSQADNCPNGLNPLSHDIFMRALTSTGKTPTEAEAIIEGVVEGTPAQRDASGKQISERGTFAGARVNAYENPLTVPDPGFTTAVGRFAYGFNLDGQGGKSAKQFEDPETHEKGVDNGLFRLYGCLANHQAPPGTEPNYPLETWESIRDTMPAWVLSITGDNLSKDGDVTVTVDRAINNVLRDAHGHTRHDQTFQIDPDPRSHNTFKGKIKDGMLTAQMSKLYLLGDQFFLTEFDLTKAQIRLTMKQDGAAEGFIGGYMKWLPLYFQHAGNGLNAETFRGLDIVGLYYALQRLADADPDPVTKKNKRLSSTWHVEIVPAFLIPADRPGDTQAQADPIIQTSRAQ